MQKSKFSESQIMAILKEHESGISLRELSRIHQVSRQTIGEWKQKYSGMQASDIRKLKDLEQEHNRLKRMYADLSMTHEALKEVLSKKF